LRTASNQFRVGAPAAAVGLPASTAGVEFAAPLASDRNVCAGSAAAAAVAAVFAAPSPIASVEDSGGTYAAAPFASNDDAWLDADADAESARVAAAAAAAGNDVNCFGAPSNNNDAGVATAAATPCKEALLGPVPLLCKYFGACGAAATAAGCRQEAGGPCAQQELTPMLLLLLLLPLLTWLPSCSSTF